MRQRIIPSWSSTVGNLIESKARVTAYCSACGGGWRVDLAVVRDKFGSDFSLWDRRPRCKMGCDCLVFFHAMLGNSTPSMKMVSYDDPRRCRVSDRVKYPEAFRASDRP